LEPPATTPSTASDLIGRIARAQLFSTLDDAALTRIATGTHLDHLVTGQYLWHAGDPAREFRIIQSGLAEVQRVTAGGEAVTLGLFGPGDALGTTAVLERGRYPADALALTATAEVLCVAAGPVLALLDHSPALALAMNRALLAHTEILRAKINIVSAGSVPRRIAALVLYLVARFGTPHDELTAHVGIELTREKISHLVGARPETVIRIMSRWHKAGWIDSGRDGLEVRRLDMIRRMGSR
jgi:CRP-like cAMP-binding protein